jgi:tetratricopeptide (TPR) repeat protein
MRHHVDYPPKREARSQHIVFESSRRGTRGLWPRLLQVLWPGLLVLAVYCYTLAPTVTGEDSGEFLAAAYHFGLPHPPGYPLWTILCGLWTHIVPFGSVAWRGNLFSAVCMAAAVVFISLTLQRMRFRPFVAGAVAAACGFSAVAWSQSVIVEVYTLNMLLIAVLFWLTASWRCDGRNRWLLWGSLVLGLGMANHHTMGFAGLGVLLWAVAYRPALLRDGRLASKCIALLIVGLAPYAYLLWAGGRDVPVKWGETSTLAGLWEHVSRGQYKSDSSIEAKVPLTAGRLASRYYYGLRWEAEQFSMWLVPLLVAGMVWLWRRRSRRVWFWWTVLLGVCCGPLFLYVTGPQADRQGYFVGKVFLSPLALISAAPLAAGLQWLLAALRPLRRKVSRAAYAVAAGAAGMLVIAVPLIANWNDNNLRHYWYAYDHARNILACMLPNAMIFPSGDHNTFPLIYLVHVEGLRPDVVIADKYGYIDLDLYKDMPDNPGKPRTKEQREAIEDWIIRHARRPAYYTVKKVPALEDVKTVAVGLVYHLLPKGKEVDTQSCWGQVHYRNLEGLAAPEDMAAANMVADYHYALGTRALDAGRMDEARQEFAECVRHAWGIKEPYNNAASALADAGLLDEAIGYYEEAARMDWTYAPARWNLARIFKSQGRFEWSAKVFEDLTRATPGDFRPYGELGFLWRDHLNNIERARYWWYESLRINPRQGQIIAALAESEQAVAAGTHAAIPEVGPPVPGDPNGTRPSLAPLVVERTPPPPLMGATSDPLRDIEGDRASPVPGRPMIPGSLPPSPETDPRKGGITP